MSISGLTFKVRTPPSACCEFSVDVPVLAETCFVLHPVRIPPMRLIDNKAAKVRVILFFFIIIRSFRIFLFGYGGEYGGRDEKNGV